MQKKNVIYILNIVIKINKIKMKQAKWNDCLYIV